MAEFGMKATELSAPQGAGANVVAPTTANPLDGIGELIEGGASLFKALATKDDDKLSSEYSKKLAALAGSDLDPVKKAVAQRKLFSEYNLRAEGNPGILKKLTDITKQHREGGALGDSEEVMKDVRDIQKERIKRASAEGVFVDPRMPEATQNEILTAHDAVLRSRQNFKDVVDKNTEARAQKRFVNEEDKLVQEKEITQALSMAGATQTDAILAQTKGIVELVGNGSMPWEVAQQQLTKMFADTDMVINTLAGSQPQLAAGYRSMFNDMRQVAFNLVDPNKRAEVGENALREFVNRKKLLALQGSPKVLAAHITNTLLPGTVAAMVASEEAPRIIFTMFGANDPTNPDPAKEASVPVGSEDEKQVIKITSRALDDALNSKDDKAKQTAKNALNNLLNNTRSVLANPLGSDNAKRLNNISQLVASPSFGRAVAEGMVDANSLMTAAEVMQVQYQQPIVDTIHNRLASKAAQIRIKSPDKPGYDSPTYLDILDISYGAGGVEFNPKPFDATKNKTAGPLSQLDAERGYAAAVRSSQMDMREVKAAIDTIVKQQSHLEGHFNYAQTFEKLKPQLLTGQRVPVEVKKETAPATGDYSKESNLKAIAGGSDTSQGFTRGVIDSLMKDLDKMTPAQRKQFKDALERLKE